jgi:hypothetical protein
MLFTPTFIGSLVAGVACWILFWFGISHVDSIPCLNQYLSRRMIFNWIRKNPQLALILTEIVNITLHGVGTAAAVLFTAGGTLVNITMIFGLARVHGLFSKSLAQLKVLGSKDTIPQ